jgi:hypothetical protein
MQQAFTSGTEMFAMKTAGSEGRALVHQIGPKTFSLVEVPHYVVDRPGESLLEELAGFLAKKLRDFRVKIFQQTEEALTQSLRLGADIAETGAQSQDL